ncbi:universal stress protein [Phenylobacterium sp.]|uniref:universal stress protein n=1 Tax=Phenylobacterium sp. TaxID=1871053 RepID=UPI0025F103C5|nr:universal stress protein [Phenylobacterium sp.]
MSYDDLLLTALTYPDATPDRAIRGGVALARRLGGELTFLTVRVDLPQLHNPLANVLIHLDQTSRLEEARSAATADLEAACARVAAEILDQPLHCESVCAKLYEEAETVARIARTRDVTLVPIGPAVLADRDLAETVLFGSGRPVVVYPETAEITPAENFPRVLIAWDGSAPAARAVADAMPVLRRAEEVRVFTALGDKPQAVRGVGEALTRHLRTHGVVARLDERLGRDEAIGPRLAAHVAETRPDLLVMGGYGHARLREFVLGGATQAILEAPPCPVMLSH